jgi:hypothetical protein
MKPIITILLAALLSLAVAANAQQQPPHVGYVFPAGGRQGTQFEVRVGGQYIAAVTNARVSGPGIQVKVVEVVKLMTQQDANALRTQLKALTDRMQAATPAAKSTATPPAKQSGTPPPKQPSGASAAKQSGTPITKAPAAPVPNPPAVPPAKQSGPPPPKPSSTPPAKPGSASTATPEKAGPLTAEEMQLVLDIRKKLQKFANRQPNPAIAQTAVLQITVSPGAEPGVRELRLQTPAGLSNPLVFQIGRLPEVVHKPVDADDLPGQLVRPLQAQGQHAIGEQPIVDVQLPAVVNGQVLPGQVDRYRFAAKKGQQLVLAVSAQQLVRYIADAVPGWFQALITLRDEEGKELASSDSFRFHPDPVLHYEVLRDGKYLVEIHDSVFRGREDFIYRMALGELPFVTGIFPLGGKAGEAARVEVQGWNLPFASLKADATPQSAGIDRLDKDCRFWPLNRVPFAWDSLPECVEQEPNDSPQQAQRVTLPIIVNGRIDRPGDRDVFRFEGQAGQEIVAEVYARRLDSPLDSVLKLTDSGGRQLAFNDDHEDKAFGLETHHADSWLRAVLPSAGTYYMHLYDAQNQGGPEYAYRLRISPPRPDFELRVVPSGLTVRAGTAVPITVHALRRDGFNGPINLELKDAPAGFSLSGATVPAGQEQVRLTLSVPRPTRPPMTLRMEGRAAIAGREVRRPVVPADDMMQAYFYHHLVAAQEWLIDILANGQPSVPFQPRDLKAVILPSGGTAEIHFVGPHGPLMQTVQLTLSEPPDGLSIQRVALSDVGVEVALRADAAKLKPGWKGNAIIEASVERTAQSAPAAAKTAVANAAPVTRRVSLGMLPAVPIEVVEGARREGP